MTVESNAGYYIARIPKLLKSYDKAAPHFRTVLKESCGTEAVDEIVAEIRGEFERLIPAIPYVCSNRFIILVSIECAQYLAMYNVLQKRGVSAEECGRMIVTIAEERLKSVPKSILQLFGWFIHTPMGKRWIKKTYVEACGNPNSPYRSKALFVPGKGNDFDFGVDYYQCGLCKFFHEQNAYDIMPYICLIDQVQARVMRIGLHRSETLAAGGSKCDFRWKRGWEAPPPWPPKWLETKDHN